MNISVNGKEVSIPRSFYFGKKAIGERSVARMDIYLMKNSKDSNLQSFELLQKCRIAGLNSLLRAILETFQHSHQGKNKEKKRLRILTHFGWGSTDVRWHVGSRGRRLRILTSMISPHRPRLLLDLGQVVGVVRQVCEDHALFVVVLAQDLVVT